MNEGDVNCMHPDGSITKVEERRHQEVFAIASVTDATAHVTGAQEIDLQDANPLPEELGLNPTVQLS